MTRAMKNEEAAKILDENNSEAWDDDPPEIFELYEATTKAISALRTIDRIRDAMVDSSEPLTWDLLSRILGES